MGVKVGHFISTSGLYGAEGWILALLGHLDDVDSLLICSSDSDKSLVLEAKNKGIKTRTIRIKGSMSILGSINKLSSLINEEGINILHTHGYKSDLVGYFAARRCNIRIISTPHGWSKNAGIKLKLYESIDRFLLRLFDLVVPVSEQLRKSFGKQKNLRSISNFVDLDSIPKPAKGNINLITYIGQLIERKRVQDIIISLKYLKNKDTRLQIIGDGPKRKELINIAKRLGLTNRVSFLGFRRDRLRLLNKSAILVLPSLLEGVPRVMMEAMAMERVLIGTDIPGIRKLIKDNKTGFLVGIKNPLQIAEKIDYIQDNVKESIKISKNARLLIKNKFSADKLAKEYVRLYEGLR